MQMLQFVEISFIFFPSFQDTFVKLDFLRTEAPTIIFFIDSFDDYVHN